jgi:hypothetical protein
MRTIIFRTLTAVTAATATCSLALPAYADDQSQPNDTLAALSIVPGLVDEATSGSQASLQVTGDGASVQTHGASGDAYSLDLVGIDAPGRVDTQAAGDGTTVISDTATDTDTVVQELADGARVIEVIGSDAAPSDFTYKLDVPEGMSMLPQEDGSILVGSQVQDGDEVTLQVDAMIGAPWAVDANGDSVPASYVLSDDGTVTMSVDHTSDVAYPVAADPAVSAGGFQVSWNILSPTTVTVLLNKARSADAEDGGAVVCVGLAFIPVVGAAAAAVCGAHNTLIRASSRYGYCERWTIRTYPASMSVGVYTGGFCK